MWRGTLKQPFAVKLYHNIWNSHDRFLNKTVIVDKNDVDSAFRILNKFKQIFFCY